MSAVTPIADIRGYGSNVHFVPNAAVSYPYSITASARAVERRFKVRTRLKSYGRTASYA
jgi:hypothetical protein